MLPFASSVHCKAKVAQLKLPYFADQTVGPDATAANWRRFFLLGLDATDMHGQGSSTTKFSFGVGGQVFRLPASSVLSHK
jgi:hypothetical protein